MNDQEEQEEQRYTLEEAQELLARRECAIHGHSYSIICIDGINAPTAVQCDKCGETWKVQPGE
jgi:hypothetical protein